MISAENIEEAYKNLEASKKDLFEANEKEIIAKEVLAIKKAELMMSGCILGKNAESRDAQLSEATKVEYAELKIAEMEKRECALVFDLASNRVSLYRDLLKLISVERIT